ncbi:DUF1517-domain-containing protein [Coccomyxa subellipsoidea C-169]|uniref:DUF1517-domain-containing protein n=1 Tax=Coccomyxa subellipsoidea (strain C-169) TaxID=574566 RepID=I0Z3M0_COCSC|nr:DUF1517-domain-containing protein [Coccomyxa subellipsoidea C-169]EIE25239.1 DUF1517-domain-containing protein [Coccomyxa subellipsoidea C-169]|eukprot:XP_005649783.1 DUF1517-domain-containing protein [Coccomyxa subellipsoidea C-169]
MQLPILLPELCPRTPHVPVKLAKGEINALGTVKKGTQAFGSASPALAARSGGRVGGSSFSSARSSSSAGSSARSYSSAGSSSRSFGSGSSYSSRSSSAPYGGGGGLNIGSLLLFGIVAYFAVSALQSYFNNSSDTDSYGAPPPRVTVAKLQVGLLGSARSLQKQLDRIASRADTNSPSGLHYILQETVLQLVRNPEYVQYGASVVSNQRDLDRGEAKFNELSVEERSKFKEETLVNVGTGIPEYIVVTILVAASGKLDLPKVSSQDQLVKALNRLAAVREDQVMAVEVLWTPEDEDDTYSRDEMLLDYPVLNNL